MAKIVSIVVSTLLSSALADTTLSTTTSPTFAPSAPSTLPTPRPTSFPIPSPTYAPQPLSCSGGVAPAENIEYKYDNPTCTNSSANSTTVWGTLEAVYSADCRSSCWGNFRDLSLEVVANTTDSDFVLQNVYQGHQCTGDLISTANVPMVEYCGLWTGDCVSGYWFGADVEYASFNIPTGLPNGFAMPPACVNWIMNARDSKVVVIIVANANTTNTTTATSATAVYTNSFTMTLNGNLDTLSEPQQNVLIGSLKSAIIVVSNAAGVTIDGDVVVTLSSGSIVAAVVFDTKGSQTDGVTTLTNSLSTTPPTVSDGTNTYTVQSVSSVKSTNNDPSNSATTVRTLGSLIAALLVITTLVL